MTIEKNTILIPSIIRQCARGIEQIPLDSALLASREIFLTQEVNQMTMMALLKQLIFLSRENPDQEITLYINSPGGEVDSGFAVYDYIKAIPAPIRTVCIGKAASMGAILFLAGDRRFMLPHAQVMIHDPSFGSGFPPGMKPDEAEECLGLLKKNRDECVKIICQATGQSEEEVRKQTRKDTFFDAKEAIEFGLATDIFTQEELQHDINIKNAAAGLPPA